MSIGLKIHKFEQSTEQTVETFNKIFPESKLNFSADAEVEIGEIVGPETRRVLLIDGKEIHHTFHSEVLMPLDLPEDLVSDQDYKRVFLRKDNTVITNANLENVVMSEEEMKLEPVEYVILQYLRGSQSPYHTQLEMAQRLNKSARGLRDVIRRMESKKMITVKNIVNHHRFYITVNEEWA